MDSRVMLAKKYEQKFLNSDKKNQTLKSILDKIILKEEEYKWSCVNWNQDQVKDFLRSLNSVSPNTISRAYTYLKNLVKFICKEEKLEYLNFQLDCELSDLVDYDQILSTTLSYPEFKSIITQLNGNNRIKAIMWLAWSLFTKEEIINLKEEDVEFKIDDFGFEIAELKTKDRCVTIEDPEAIESIKQCIGQTEYIINAKVHSVEKTKKIILKNTKYLIKPTMAGPGAKTENENATITNPSTTLQKALKQHKVVCPGIDVNSLTIEDIRRSKVVYMLSNPDIFSKEDIMDAIGGGNNESYMYWLQKVMSKKYNVTINYKKKKGARKNEQ